MSGKFPQFPKSRRLWIVSGMLVILLLAAAVLVFWVFRETPLVGLLFSTEEAVSTPMSVTKSPTEKAPATPIVKRPTVTPPAAPTAPATRYLVWSEVYARIYLREEPGGKILRSVPNGVFLQVSEIRTAGKVDWAHVSYSDGDQPIEGWIAVSLIATIRSNLPLALVSGDEGAYLRAEPQGDVLALLQLGTPVQIIETADLQGSTWAHVALPDERSGWIASRLLTMSSP